MPREIRSGHETITYDVFGDGPALVLGHGLLGDLAFWDGLIPVLSQTHRVIVVEARGHGRSTANSRFTLEDLAQDWLRVLDAEDVDRAALVGFSMGGMTAMRVALAAPERVSHLGLLSTNAGTEALPGRIQGRALALTQKALGPTTLLDPIVSRLMFSSAFRQSNPAVVDIELARARSHNSRAVAHAVEAVFMRRSIKHELEKIAAPTLVLCGDRDVLTPVGGSYGIAKRIPGSKTVILPGIGHMTPNEAPADVEKELLEFLRPA